MNLFEFIRLNNLKPADAIVLRKKFLGMVDHYAIFLGYRSGHAVFVANYRNGVKEIPHNELVMFLQKLEPTAIDRFPGQDNQRPNAVRRALARVGEKAYNYIANNCEHFKNWVHHGKNYSSQVKNVGNIAIGLGIGAGLLALSSEQSKTGGKAIGLLLLGAILQSNAGDD